MYKIQYIHGDINGEYTQICLSTKILTLFAFIMIFDLEKTRFGICFRTFSNESPTQIMNSLHRRQNRRLETPLCCNVNVIQILRNQMITTHYLYLFTEMYTNKC